MSNYKAYLSILGGFLTHIVTGTFYLWGNISLNVSSYYKYHGYPDLKTSTVQAVFPALYFGLAFGHLVGIPIARKFGHKLTSGINLLFYCGSLFLATISNFWLFILFQGFMPGVFIGIEYLIPVDNAYAYFPKKKGMVAGLILCAFGFSPVIFNPICQYFLNPNNISPNEDGFYPEEVANNLRYTLRMLVVIYLIVGTIGVLLMFETKQYKKVEAQIQSEMDSLLLEEHQMGQIPVKCQKDIVKTRQFWIAMFELFCLTGEGFLIVSHYKEFGLNYFKDDNYLSRVGQVGGIGSGFARFLWGFALDYVSHKYLVLVNISMAISISATIIYTVHSETLFMIWVVLTYLQYGGVYTLFPGLLTQLYGAKFGPIAYNLAYNGIPFSNATQFLLTKYMEEQFIDGQLFYIYVGINACAFITQLTLVFQKKQKSLEQQ